jgi:hypothetical protein
MKALYKVTTRDVDGTESRRYKTYEGAAKRFQEMSGYSLPEGKRKFALVSDFGCVVSFLASDDAIIPEVKTNDDADYFYDCDTRQEYIGIPHASDYI